MFPLSETGTEIQPIQLTETESGTIQRWRN